MRYQPLWQQNASYPAGTDRILVNTLWPASVTAGGAPSIQANTLNVSIAPGTTAVALTSGNNSALCRWDAAEVVALGSVPAAGQSRIDLIVLQVRDAALDAGANNDFLFQVIPGTATTGTPAPPAVPVNAAPICQVTVPGGGTNNLNSATIGDRRSPLAPRDTLHAAYGRAAAFTVPTTDTSITWDTLISDPAGMWSASQVGFVAPTAGLYQISFTLEISTPANGNAGLRVYQAGSAVRLTNFIGQATAQVNTLPLTASLKCTAGQLIQTAAICVPTGLGALTGAAASNFVSFDYLGPG